MISITIWEQQPTGPHGAFAIVDVDPRRIEAVLEGETVSRVVEDPHRHTVESHKTGLLMAGADGKRYTVNEPAASLVARLADAGVSLTELVGTDSRNHGPAHARRWVNNALASGTTQLTERNGADPADQADYQRTVISIPRGSSSREWISHESVASWDARAA